MRHANPGPRLAVLCLLLAAAGAPAATTRTVVLASEPFSLGYGWTWDHTNPPNWTNGWTTMETAAVNTPTNQGAFTLSPVFQSAPFGSIGVEFPGRVLADGVTFGYRATAGSSAFQAAITATWGGDLPEDAAPDPDLRIRFVITQIRLHACGTSTQTTTSLAFSETTPEHGAQSDAIDVNLGTTASNGTFTKAAYWKQLAWDPVDFWTGGASTTRTFALVSPENRGLDGFEIFGYVEIAYEAIPPGLMILLR